MCLVVILLFGTVQSTYFSSGQVVSSSAKVSTNVRGSTYQDIGYSNGTHVWTGGLAPFIQASDGTYVPFIISQNTTHLIVDSKVLPFVMNKADCTITLFDNAKQISQNPSVLIGKQFTGIAVKQVGVTGWIEQDVSNIACTYSTITNSTGFYLTIQRNQANWGNLKSVYALPVNGSPETLNWFTNNNPLWSSNYEFGFVDNYNNVNIKSLQIDQTQLSNFTSAQGSGWNYTSSQTTSNKLNFVNNNNQVFTVDPGSASNDLISVLAIQKTNPNQLNIKFEYGKGSSITGLGQTIFQDPVYGWVGSSWIRLTSTATSGTTCSTTQSGHDFVSYQWFLTPKSSVTGDCEGLAEKFLIQNITAPITVSLTQIKFDTGAVVPGGYIADNCDFTHVTVDPLVSANYPQAYTDIISGFTYASNDISCSVANRAGNIVTLGSTANNDFANSVTNGYYTVGIRDTHFNTRNSNQYGEYIANVALQVTYTTGGGGGSGITSINGDTTSAQTIAVNTQALTMTNNGATHTIDLAQPITKAVTLNVLTLGGFVNAGNFDITNTGNIKMNSNMKLYLDGGTGNYITYDSVNAKIKIVPATNVAICIGTGC